MLWEYRIRGGYDFIHLGEELRILGVLDFGYSGRGEVSKVVL